MAPATSPSRARTLTPVANPIKPPARGEGPASTSRVATLPITCKHCLGVLASSEITGHALKSQSAQSKPATTVRESSQPTVKTMPEDEPDHEPRGEPAQNPEAGPVTSPQSWRSLTPRLFF